jgi:hypothetical protein
MHGLNRAREGFPTCCISSSASVIRETARSSVDRLASLCGSDASPTPPPDTVLRTLQERLPARGSLGFALPAWGRGDQFFTAGRTKLSLCGTVHPVCVFDQPRE